jgi:hypothetical protein
MDLLAGRARELPSLCDLLMRTFAGSAKISQYSPGHLFPHVGRATKANAHAAGRNSRYNARDFVESISAEYNLGTNRLCMGTFEESATERYICQNTVLTVGLGLTREFAADFCVYPSAHALVGEH